MSVLGESLLNAIQNNVKNEYGFHEIKSVVFVFDYISNKVSMEYSGCKEPDGEIIKGQTKKAEINRTEKKFQMLGMIENSIEKKIKQNPEYARNGIKLSAMRMRVRPDVGGFECECFFTAGDRKVKETHLTKL